MAININQFVSQFQGGARPSLFRVSQVFPGLVASGDAGRKFEFQCKAAQMPSLNIPSFDVMYQGRQVKVAGNKVWEDITLTIINDTDFLIHDAYDAWHQLINGHESNIGTGNPSNYYADVVIEQLGQGEEVIKRRTLVNAFPTNVSALELDWGSTDQVQEFTVTLSYNYIV